MSAGFVPLALFGFGCSLIIPLDDYIGKAPPPAHGGTGGDAQAGTAGVGGIAGTAGTSNGGSAAAGEAGAEAGHEESGASGTGAEAGAGNEGGTGVRGGAGGAGNAGTNSGGHTGGGQGGASGAGMGGGGMGGAGTSGGVGGAGTSGAGMSGAGMGGCAGANLDTDHEHCGSCENACGVRQECIAGYCASSPCDGICAGLPVTVVPLTSVGFKEENIPAIESCWEVVGYDPKLPAIPLFIAWNFQNRMLKVNDLDVAPKGDPGCLIDSKLPQRVGGYCVHVGAKAPDQYSGFQFPSNYTTTNNGPCVP